MQMTQCHIPAWAIMSPACIWTDVTICHITAVSLRHNYLGGLYVTFMKEDSMSYPKGSTISYSYRETLCHNPAEDTITHSFRSTLCQIPTRSTISHLCRGHSVTFLQWDFISHSCRGHYVTFLQGDTMSVSCRGHCITFLQEDFMLHSYRWGLFTFLQGSLYHIPAGGLCFIHVRGQYATRAPLVSAVKVIMMFSL